MVPQCPYHAVDHQFELVRVHVEQGLESVGHAGLDELKEELPMVRVAVEVSGDHRYRAIEDRLYDLRHEINHLRAQPLEHNREE